MLKTEKMSHGDFVDLCMGCGIIVDKITRNYVYIKNRSKSLEEVVSKKKRTDLGLLPNNCQIPGYDHLTLSKYKIYNWSEGCNGTILDMIRNRRKIMIIKCLRSNLGCGLKEAKDIAESNWSSWLRIANDEFSG